MDSTQPAFVATLPRSKSQRSASQTVSKSGTFFPTSVAASRRVQCHGSTRFAATRLKMADGKTLQALIFDCDGVLADTERDAHRISFNMAFKEKNLSTEWDVPMYGKMLEVGGGKERMTAYWNEYGWPENMPKEESKRAQTVKELHLRKTDLFMQLIQSGKIPLRNGVKKLVTEAMKEGIPVAVCSTSNEKAVSEIVKLIGQEYSPKIRIFAGDIVKKKKPSPDIYLLAKDELKLDPARVVVVEDSYIGLQAAKDAGMNCVITKSTYTVNEDFGRADAVFDELEKDSVTLATLKALVDKKDKVKI